MANRKVGFPKVYISCIILSSKPIVRKPSATARSAPVPPKPAVLSARLKSMHPGEKLSEKSYLGPSADGHDVGAQPSYKHQHLEDVPGQSNA